MSPMQKHLSLACVGLLTLTLGCGGGGGGNTPPPPTTYTLTFTAGSGGGLTGATTQTVTAGGSATPVTALANTGYTFTNWTGSGFTTTTANPLTVSNVTQNLTITANFTQNSATSLSYTDPTTGTYQLKRNPSLSTSTHLVLDLVGTATAPSGAGVTATFIVNATKVSWTNVAATDTGTIYVQNAAFNLGAAPQLLKGSLSGGTLQVTSAQKGYGNPVPLNTTLLRVALDLKGGQAPGTITLTADDPRCQILDGTGAIVPISISVGTLAAQ